MIDASSGGSGAGRSDDGLSDTSDLEEDSVGDFNETINAAGNDGEEEIDEQGGDADNEGLVFRDWRGFVRMRGSLGRTTGLLVLLTGSPLLMVSPLL